jgi:hypothetical protein
MRYFASIIIVSFLSTSAWAEGVSDQVSVQLVNPNSFEERVKALGNETIYSQSCCKHCRKGKACGNSCISKSYTCRKGKGCACN